MICTQKATTRPTGRILITSDLADPIAAQKETEAWLRQHRYEKVELSRPLLVFCNGVCVREWVQAEPQDAAPSPSGRRQSLVLDFLLRPLPGFHPRPA